MTTYCDGCGRPRAEGDHTRCAARRAATDPPRFCAECGRKLAVQVLPVSWVARCVKCGPVPRQSSSASTNVATHGKPR